ncbi:hypothetical protein Dimus_012322 [Dionaea muscipula]
MEANETGLIPFYHPHQPPSALTPSTASVSNGLIPNHVSNSAEAANQAALYPHSVAGKAPSPTAVEPLRRKRGRPRKYATPEEAAAAKRAATSLHPTQPKKKEQPTSGGPSSSSASSSKKSHTLSMGITGQSFSPHVISVVDGEDVAQKIMLFAQQARREMCILCASGCVKIASLREQATTGGNVTYEGHFRIVSLSGSYVQTDLGGRAGGLSACLCSPEGQIVGGGIGGPLVAAGPVEVIVGTFQLETKKEPTTGTGAASLPSPVSMSTSAYRPVIETSGRYQVSGTDGHPNMAGASYMVSQAMHVQPSRATDWRGVDYNFSGQARHGAGESPENGDYDQMPD